MSMNCPDPRTPQARITGSQWRTTVVVPGGEYRSRTDDLPEASSGRPGPYTAKTLLQYVMNLLFPKK